MRYIVLSSGIQYICSNPLGYARIEGVTRWKCAFWIVELNDAPATIQQSDVLQNYWFLVLKKAKKLEVFISINFNVCSPLSTHTFTDQKPPKNLRWPFFFGQTFGKKSLSFLCVWTGRIGKVLSPSVFFPSIDATERQVLAMKICVCPSDLGHYFCFLCVMLKERNVARSWSFITIHVVTV